MSLHSFIFYFFEGLAAVSAIGILFIRNIFHGALLLIVCLLCVAALYIFAFAEFIAVTQILVYAGGILVVIMFGIMLTAKVSGKPLVVKGSKWFGGIVVGLSFFIMLAYFILEESFPSRPGDTLQPTQTLQQTGMALMTDFILPFEIAGILLLIALIGAAVTVSTAKQSEP